MSRRAGVKPIVRRARADEDVLDAIDHYLNESSAAATAFVDALEQVYRHIQRWPATGSPRYAHALDLPGLRFWRFARHPYLVFYVEKDDRIEVWRVLHSSRDIPQWLQEGNDTNPS